MRSLAGQVRFEDFCPAPRSGLRLDRSFRASLKTAIRRLPHKIHLMSGDTQLPVIFIIYITITSRTPSSLGTLHHTGHH